MSLWKYLFYNCLLFLRCLVLTSLFLTGLTPVVSVHHCIQQGEETCTKSHILCRLLSHITYTIFKMEPRLDMFYLIPVDTERERHYSVHNDKLCFCFFFLYLLVFRVLSYSKAPEISKSPFSLFCFHHICV